MDERLREVTELVIDEFELHISPEELLERAAYSQEMAQMRDVVTALAHETGAVSWVPGAHAVLQRCGQLRASNSQFDRRYVLARFRLIDRFWKLPD